MRPADCGRQCADNCRRVVIRIGNGYGDETTVAGQVKVLEAMTDAKPVPYAG